MDENDLLEQINFKAPPIQRPDYSDLVWEGEPYQSMYDFLEPYIKVLGHDFVEKWKLKL
jgi:hypothetical protein